MNELLSVSNLNVNRQGKSILRDVSLSIGLNDFVTIIGPNGAGKSTLIKCLIGLCKPDSGLITHKKGLKTGYVPQKFTCDDIMPVTVRRFLALRNKLRPQDIEALTEETGIQHLLEKPLARLSGGELQRVLLSRSLINNPDLLVLDEPAQNLDVSGQLAFYKHIERIYTTRKLSILMISHDLHMVMASTRQVICLFHHVCCSGAPQAVARHPEFINLFGNDMARMMAIYQHSHNHTHDGASYE